LASRNIETTIKVYSLDQNLFDNYSNSVGNGFDLEPVTMNMDGGLGVFGSYSVDSVSITIHHNE